jgi:hypothetical protein
LFSVDTVAILQGADVSVTLGILDLFQLFDHVVRPLPESGVARRSPHQTDSREVMARDVSSQVASGPIPSAVAFRFGLESGMLTKERQHAVGLECQQIFRVGVLGRFEGTSGQPDMIQGYRIQLDRLAALQLSGIVILGR